MGNRLNAAACALIFEPMAQTFLVFEFGSNEDAAQQARLTLERWKQSFRLDKKLLLKFDREDPAEADDLEPSESAKREKKPKPEATEGKIVMIVRLDFSDHEKLSQTRWVERIPADALFKDAGPKVIRHGDAQFAATAKRFENLA
jgi:hypothetical protein